MAALEADNARLRTENAAKLAAGAPPAAVDPAAGKGGGMLGLQQKLCKF
jgi:hypothetical protein